VPSSISFNIFNAFDALQNYLRRNYNDCIFSKLFLKN